jgi:hypothetical protein
MKLGIHKESETATRITRRDSNSAVEHRQQGIVNINLKLYNTVLVAIVKSIPIVVISC